MYYHMMLSAASPCVSLSAIELGAVFIL